MYNYMTRIKITHNHSHNSHFPYAILVPRKAHKTQFKSAILLL